MAVDKYVTILADAAWQRQATDDANALFIQTAHHVWGKKWSPVFPVKEITTGEPDGI